MKPKGTDHDFATTFGSGFADARFRRRARRLPVAPSLDALPRHRFAPLAEARLFATVLAAALRERTLLLFSSRGYCKPELLAAIAIGLLPARLRPAIVFYGEMFQPDAGLRGRLEHWIMRRVDRATARFVLYSEEERVLFSRTWGVAYEKTRACPLFLPPPAPSGEEPEAVGNPSERPYVFAGGSSFRDYGPLIEAARCLPDHEFVICARDRADLGRMPPNVRLGSLERRAYRTLLHRASAVVVPLRADLKRAAGTFTFLQAMRMGKPTVVSRAPGTHEYIEDGETGFIVDGSANGYARAIRFILDPANRSRVDAVRRAARRSVAERFTLERYVTGLLAVVDEVLGPALTSDPVPARAPQEGAVGLKSGVREWGEASRTQRASERLRPIGDEQPGSVP